MASYNLSDFYYALNKQFLFFTYLVVLFCASKRIKIFEFHNIFMTIRGNKNMIVLFFNSDLYKHCC